MKFVTLNLAKVLIIAIITTFFLNNLTAQRTIKGVVVDGDNNMPLMGATVVDRDEITTGTTTDLDGNFQLTLSSNAKAIRITYVGYQPLVLELVVENNFVVKMSSGQLLQDVVVIGYGTVRREDVTGAIQTVTSEDFNKGAITSPQQLLAGKVPGVSITSGGGPDDGAAIRIRGESSLGASNDPLIVVDGVPLDNGGVAGNRNPLNIINPNDIESMTVLKDASATAIYGSRAAGGVILITTKKGQGAAPLSVSYNGNVSFGQTANRVDVLSADEFRTVFQERYASNEAALAVLGDANTDWQDQIYQTAVGTDHNMSISGGISNLPYRLSLGYTNMDGLLKTDNFERYTAGINFNPGYFNNTLQLNIGVKGMLTRNQFADRGAIGSAVGFDPTQPVFDAESPFLGGYRTWAQANGTPLGLAPQNPMALLDLNLRNDRSTVTRYITNASADYRIPFLPDLRANLSLGYDHSSGSGSIFIPGENQVPFSFDAINGGGVDNSYEQTRTNSVLEFYLNYKKNLGDHDIDVMGGYSWQRFYDENSFRNSNAAGTPSETIERNNIASELYLLSLFGRFNYTFKESFLFTFTLRGDATSRFAPENRWGLFPALAAGYKILDRNTLFFNNLKIRAGWGVTGQQEIGDRYVYQARYLQSLQNARYQFGEDFLTTYRPNGYDRNIKWEETTTYNLGLDFSLIKNRVYGNLEAYQRNTQDLLNFIPVPAGTNLTNFINTNIGSMVNRGIELGLFTTPISRGDFSWDLGMNVAYNYNEITNLTATEDPDYLGIFTGGIAGGVGNTIQIHSVGFAPRSFYVFEQKYDDNGNLLEGQFVDRNGDGIVDDDDKYRFEQPAPFYIFGITSNLRYKNLDFSFAGRANLGNYVYNNVATDIGHQQRMLHPSLFTANVHRSAIDNSIERQASVTFSDHFVQNASFFRMDHITMGYTFENLLGKYLRVYGTLQNAFVITKYEGLDPEVFGGIDNNFYPRPRTLVLGVSVTF
jgi:TonB-dependent starch-binding outer membrane protein SusC